ncbi:MAG: hypothetical protein KAS32_09400 [Candidatus Peribacteraceae bacterium]|nr:hypothetical protein [Candidatus Peribacteraceae bacterium]
MQEEDGKLYVGISGYSAQKFDEAEARELIEEALDDIENEYIESGDYEEIVIVSGLTNMGVPKIAYEVADNRSYGTVGIAPEQVNEEAMELYPVDEIIIEGETFGDESEEYIDIIDVLVTIGGGAQTMTEIEMAEADELSVLEYDLESLNGE